MPTVYRVNPDRGCQALDPVDQNAFAKETEKSWKFDGYPVKDAWRPLEVYVREVTLKKPDIYELFRTLAFEPEAARVVQLCLDQSCEQLLLPFEGRDLIVANVTYVIDVLDKKKSEYDPTFPHIIEKFVFHKERLDNSLFSIPETRVNGIIYTVEGIDDPDREFKPLVEKHKLKGLKFREIYSW